VFLVLINLQFHNLYKSIIIREIMVLMDVKAVLYDLDGTIIDTERMHEEAWIRVCAEYGVVPSAQMLLQQKGMTGEAAVKMMFPPSLRTDAQYIIRKETEYALKNVAQVRIHAGFMEAYNVLTANPVGVAVCTSALPNLVSAVLDVLPELQCLRDRIICKGMYTKGKPSAEPLLAGLRELGLPETTPAMYVGDAFMDYLSAQNAGMRFVYFCPDDSRKDERIPDTVPIIKDHRELLGL